MYIHVCIGVESYVQQVIYFGFNELIKRLFVDLFTFRADQRVGSIFGDFEGFFRTRELVREILFEQELDESELGDQIKSDRINRRTC